MNWELELVNGILELETTREQLKQVSKQSLAVINSDIDKYAELCREKWQLVKRTCELSQLYEREKRL